MQDLRLIDQHQLSKRLQGIIDEEHANIVGKIEDDDYDEILHMNVKRTNDTPPPLPPRQLKYA